MNLSIAIELENNQFLLRSFENHEVSTSSIIDENNEETNFIEIFKNVDLVFTENPRNELLPLTITYASPTALHISKDLIENMVYDDAINLLSKINEENSIRNNISLITNITSEGNRIAKIFHENREVFILNLWRILYKNLSTYDLQILFQTVDSKDSKNLLFKKLSSFELEDLVQCREEEELLFKDLSSEFGKTLNVSNYSKKNGELEIAITLKTTNIIVMAKVHQFTLLQKSSIQGLLNSIDFFIKK
jgi:hypothetical protein